MKEATNEQFQQVMSALAAVGGDYLPDNQEEQREGLFNALYDLACRGVIPPEIKLSVEIVSEGPGSWAFRFSDDLQQWLGSTPRSTTEEVQCPWCRKSCTLQWRGPLRFIHCGQCGHWSPGPFVTNTEVCEVCGGNSKDCPVCVPYASP